MLTAKNYSQQYVYECRARVDEQLSMYKDLISTARDAVSKRGTSMNPTIDPFELV